MVSLTVQPVDADTWNSIPGASILVDGDTYGDPHTVGENTFVDIRVEADNYMNETRTIRTGTSDETVTISMEGGEAGDYVFIDGRPVLYDPS